MYSFSVCARMRVCLSALFLCESFFRLFLFECRSTARKKKNIENCWICTRLLLLLQICVIVFGRNIFSVFLFRFISNTASAWLVRVSIVIVMKRRRRRRIFLNALPWINSSSKRKLRSRKRPTTKSFFVSICLRNWLQSFDFSSEFSYLHKNCHICNPFLGFSRWFLYQRHSNDE